MPLCVGLGCRCTRVFCRARGQRSRGCRVSRRSSYTVIGSPERPRPGPRTANPSLTARRRDGSFSPSSMYAVILSTSVRPEVSDGRLHRFGRDPLVASLFGHPPACLDFVRRDPIDASTSQAQLRASEEPVLSQSRIAQGPNPDSRHCISAAPVSRNASAGLSDAHACSASSSRVSGAGEPLRPENDVASCSSCRVARIASSHAAVSPDPFG